MPPSGPRPTARPGAGPGRGKPRARPQGRERSGAGDPAVEPTVAFEASSPTPVPKPSEVKATARKAPAPAAATGSTPGQRSGSTAMKPGRAGAAGAAVTRRSASVLQRAVRANLTARALALVVVVLVLTISYATSLRIYFSQAHEIATTKAEIAESQAAITDLQGQIGRWNDPAYVAAQARERLGWLVPGETGYTVVGADGKPLGGGLTLESSTTADPGQPQPMWWDRMWGSVQAADKPAPVKVNPAKRPPVTTKTKPR